MRILLLTHAFNSLCQRLFVALQDDGHDLSIEFDVHDDVTLEAVELFQPDLIIAPYLKRVIPESIWSAHVCLIVHPGIVGDRGPSALDWAILNQEQRWGVTVLQANAEMDGGDIWASIEFPMRDVAKSSLYRNEVAQTALQAVKLAVSRFVQAGFRPEPLDYSNPDVFGECRPVTTQQDRSIDWLADDTETVLRKINSADGFPGIRDKLFGRQLFLYDARIASGFSGPAGEALARSGPAICRATRDGAIWIGHMKDKQSSHPFKLSAMRLLADEVSRLPEIPAEGGGYCDIWYEKDADVGYLHFPFYNGAMDTEQCESLLKAYRQATLCNTRVIVLMGGSDFWSNGMHLNVIEAAASPADESWRNINAMNDLAEAIICTDSHLVVSAMQGNAGAGGVFLARAADLVWAHHSVILNPHYKDMGNLYGSEYWTYLLPRYAGVEHVNRISQARLPMGVNEANMLGLIDHVFEADKTLLVEQIKARAVALAADDSWTEQLAAKNERRVEDEKQKPLAEYRREELLQMRRNFYGFDPSYHVARYNFVYKVCKSRTPLTLAVHRDQRVVSLSRRAA
jgi:putative two-component system hydrogenase maturation factor HypX/HoxX